jgi:hypothetical protein
MMRDAIHAGVLLLAFATLVTMHVTLTIGLLGRPPRWRAPVGLLIAPLAPWWGWQEKMRLRSALWVGSALVYVVAFIAARCG